jgi:hypothetical protein
VKFNETSVNPVIRHEDKIDEATLPELTQHAVSRSKRHSLVESDADVPKSHVSDLGSSNGADYREG